MEEVYDWLAMRLLVMILAAIGLLVGLPVLWTVGMTAAVDVVDESSGTLVSSGVERSYLVHVPRGYSQRKAVPLVISLHAAMNWPAFQKDLTRWNGTADRNGFLVVYPAGLGNGPKTWFMRRADEPSQMPDVKFVGALIDRLGAQYNIDPARIYVDGMSNGGGMAFALSCTMSRRIAAVGAVAAAQSLPWEWCTDKRPVPMIAFHGTDDPIVPYRGGKVAIAPKPFPPVEEWVANWARRNGCSQVPAKSRVASDVTRLDYSQCISGADVVLFTVEAGGHAWPGGKPMPEWIVGRTTTSVDATAELWKFFQAHPLSR